MFKYETKKKKKKQYLEKTTDKIYFFKELSSDIALQVFFIFKLRIHLNIVVSM